MIQDIDCQKKRYSLDEIEALILIEKLKEKLDSLMKIKAIVWNRP